MDDQELAAFLHDLESERVERKSSLGQKDKILKTLCAFANDLPGEGQVGIVFVGVEDDGRCSGLTVTDGVLQELSDLRSDGTILPFPMLRVEKRRLKGCEVAVITVTPSDSPPVRLRGRSYVRVGPTTRQATPEEERRLTEKRRAQDLPFDLRPLPSATLKDLDVELFQRGYLPTAVAPDVLEQNQRGLEDQLRSLRFASSDHPLVPTVLGILTIGKDPRRFIPGSYVQFVRFDGEDLLSPIKDQREIDGPMVEMLGQLDETLRIHISVAAEITGGDREARHPDYPIVALQQLLRNAILHRNYEGTAAPVRLSWFGDRIEITNPGGPYGQVTRERFGQPGVTDYRNPHLAEVMKNLGYVQRFGVGIALARGELAKNGNPPPEFELHDTAINVKIWPRRA